MAPNFLFSFHSYFCSLHYFEFWSRFQIWVRTSIMVQAWIRMYQTKLNGNTAEENVHSCTMNTLRAWTGFLNVDFDTILSCLPNRSYDDPSRRTRSQTQLTLVLGGWTHRHRSCSANALVKQLVLLLLFLFLHACIRVPVLAWADTN